MTPAGKTGIRGQAALISARLDRLPTTRYIWKLVLLLSLGGCFEFYDLFLMTYIGPGLVRSGLFSERLGLVLRADRAGELCIRDVCRAFHRDAGVRICR